MNKWIFTGNLGRDAEQKFLQNGTAVLQFTVAVKSGYGDKAKTTWASCSMFGKRAEGSLAQYLVKGAQVCIAGEVNLDEWDKDGVTQKMLKVNVGELDLIGGKQEPKPQQRTAPQQAPQRPAPQRPQPPAPQQGGYAPAPNQHPTPQQNFSPELGEGWDDDIPFAPIGLQYPSLLLCC